MIPWPDADILILRSAIVSGVLTVSYSGPPSRTVTYQSLSSMLELLALINSQNGDLGGTRRKYHLGTVCKGL